MGEERVPSHLDDEALNAVLDGEASAGEQDHADSCARCSARLERLRRVAVAVATPVEPADGGRRAAMVAVALGATDAADVGPAPVAGHDEVVTPIATRRPGRRRPRDRRASWALAAAGVVVLAVAVPLLGRFQDGSELQEAAGVAEDSTAQAPILGGDLGDIERDDLNALAGRIERHIEQPQVADQMARPEAAAPDRDTPEAPAPEALASGTAGSRCEEMARERDPGLGLLSYVAQARLDGTDAVVLAFRATAGGAPSPPTTEVLVLAVEDCTELASAS